MNGEKNDGKSRGVEGWGRSGTLGAHCVADRGLEEEREGGMKVEGGMEVEMKKEVERRLLHLILL